MEDSFIKLSRKITEWEWYSDKNTRAVFIHMLIKANWKEGCFKGRIIPRGSFVSSNEKLATETSLSIQNVRTAIKHLKLTDEVTSVSYSECTVFTVKNYCAYQDDNKQPNKRLTSNQQATNKQLTTIEEVKKERNKEIKIYSENSLLDKSIKDFIEYRKSIKAAMTDKAIQLLINKLCKFSTNESEQIEILNQSMLNGWKGIFELKQDKPHKPSNNKFNNFTGRDYDFDELEKQLIGNNN